MSVQGIKTNILAPGTDAGCPLREGGTSIHTSNKSSRQGRGEEVGDGLAKCLFPDRRLARRTAVRCLLEAGALSASIEDADAGTPDEQPQFGSPARSIHRAGTIHASSLCWNPSRCCRAIGGLPPHRPERSAVFTIEAVAEQNWVQLTQSQFDPIRVSGRYGSCPPGTSRGPSAVNLILDPAWFRHRLAPTTRLCLEWLERNVSDGCSVLDYGCGSAFWHCRRRLGAGRVAASISTRWQSTRRAPMPTQWLSALFADSANRWRRV